MRLKRVELIGFKSFADKTIIEVESGITVIVGPNGSGKSNIADAIRWVLGEQSAKTLRGDSMADVIFSGTEKRKMLGYAEVSLVLDNVEHDLPIDYSEVVATRRIYRSGEAEYYINKTECRLKDIQELFMDTGIGKDGYSIIGQGKIDEIISSKSEERRNIFEEAAGIVKYRARRDEALKKLENAKLNLARVNDIIQEVNNNLISTEEKAVKAKQYLDFKEELKKLDVTSFVSCISNSDEILDEMSIKFDSVDESLTQEEKRQEQITSSKNDARVYMEELILEINTCQEELYDVTSKKDKLVANIDTFDSRVQNMKDMAEKLRLEIIENTTSIEISQTELMTRQDKLALLRTNKDKFDNELLVKEEQLKNELLNMTDKELGIEKLKEKIENIKEENNNLKIMIAENNVTIANENKALESFDIKYSESLKNSDAIIQSLKLEENRCEDLDKQKNDLIINQKELINQCETFEVELKRYNETQTTLTQQLIEANSHFNYMTNLEKENAGYIGSVKAVIEFAKNNLEYTNKVYGTLANIVSTDNKYEKAIEVAMGGYIQNIVVDKAQTAKELIGFLKNNKLGRATFLPLESIREYKEEGAKLANTCPGFIAMAVNLVQFEKKYTPAITLALGRTAIVDTLENGIKMSKVTRMSCKIVTLSGEIIATTGSITGGENTSKSLNLIGRNKKIEEISVKVNQIKELLNENVKHKEFIEKKKSEINETIAQLQSKINQINVELNVSAERKNNIQKQYENIQLTYVDGENKIKKIKAQIIDLEKINVDHQEKINENMKVLETNNSEIDEYTRFNKEKQLHINILNEDIMNLKISVNSFDESKNSIDEMLDKIKKDIEVLEHGIIRKKENIDMYLKELASSQENNEKDKQEVEIFISQIEGKKSNIEKLKELQKQNISTQSTLDEELKQINKIIEKLKIDKAKLEEKKTKYEDEKIALINKMWEEYQLAISSAKEYFNLVSDEIKQYSKAKIEQAIIKTKQKMKDLGEVSVSAIEEYAVLKERYSFMENQRIDLSETVAKLENLVDNTTNIMKTQFANEFVKINNNFKQAFGELFGGGRAELILTDDKNILECGIEIEAQPPGKKLQTISLLSGGERALTAIAILFAILKLKAPPFCILDEIEAALDDVNVTRFAEYIKQYSKEAQFLVITHRKGTMEIASSIYGVTMQEKGVSTLISMKLK